MYIVTAAQMREMDQTTIADFGLPGRVLMENAGLGATRVMLARFPDLKTRRVGVLAGRGNNGGDGFVMARYLAQQGVRVSVFLLARRHDVKGDAAANLPLLDPLAVPVYEMPDPAAFAEQKPRLRHQGVWVDAMLGTGLTSDVRPFYQEVIEFINNSGKPILAVDIPSGLSSDTGKPCGTSIQATVTASFAYPKIGHILYPGAELTGRLEIIDIGIPPHIADQVAPRQQLLTPEKLRTLIPRRDTVAHKGTTGHVLVIAGGPGKTGAAAMTATAAMRAGAGLVSLGIASGLNAATEPQVMEAMTCPLPEDRSHALDESALAAIRELLPGKKCLAIGPGLGTAAGTRLLIEKLLAHVTIPVVIDADGLNCIAHAPEILRALKAPGILTPHPGEMARLTGTTTRAVQADRIGCARDFACRFNIHVVLKGARTVVALPNGQVFINPTGNPGMASGGMGDVLTGIIAGLTAQGTAPASAALAGVYLHGAAADQLAETKGPYGYLASEVMGLIPNQIARFVHNEGTANRHSNLKTRP